MDIAYLVAQLPITIGGHGQPQGSEMVLGGHLG